MRAYANADDELTHYVSIGGSSQTFVYETANGTKEDGTGQRLRRVTSLLRDSDGYMNNTDWNSVYIATPSDNHLWVTNDTYDDESTTYVTATETNQYYNETIDIDIDTD